LRLGAVGRHKNLDRPVKKVVVAFHLLLMVQEAAEEKAIPAGDLDLVRDQGSQSSDALREDRALGGVRYVKHVNRNSI
jgi:hypothetical protein